MPGVQGLGLRVEGLGFRFRPTLNMASSVRVTCEELEQGHTIGPEPRQGYIPLETAITWNFAGCRHAHVSSKRWL